MADLGFRPIGIRTLLGGAKGWPPYDFDLNAITFTPSMSKRTGSVFAAAPIVQGLAAGTGTPDVLSLPTGTAVSGYYYPNFDAYQGTLTLWWTPEFSSGGSYTGVRYFGYASANYLFAYDYSNNRYTMTVGGQTMTATVAVVAGTTYQVSFSWDTKRTIDGTNYGRITVNDAHTFGITTKPTASAPSTIYLGSNGTAGPLSARMQAPTLCRRVLTDGTYGTDVGNGDELALIFGGGV